MGIFKLPERGWQQISENHTDSPHSDEEGEDREQRQHNQETPGDGERRNSETDGRENSGTRNQGSKSCLHSRCIWTRSVWFMLGIFFTGVVLYLGFRFPSVFTQLGIGPPLPVGSLSNNRPPARLRAYVGGNFIEFAKSDNESRWESPQILIANRQKAILRGYFSPVCVSFPDLTTGEFTAVIQSRFTELVNFSRQFVVHRGEGCFVFNGSIPEGVDTVDVHISDNPETSVNRQIKVEDVNCRSLGSETDSNDFRWKSDETVCLDSVFSLRQSQTLTIEPGAIVVLRGQGMIKNDGGAIQALGTQYLPILVTRPSTTATTRNTPSVLQSNGSFSLLSGMWITDTSEEDDCPTVENPVMDLRGSGVSFLMNGILSCRKLVSAVDSRFLIRDSLISTRFATTQFSFFKSYPVFYKVHWIHQSSDADVSGGKTKTDSQSGHLFLNGDYSVLLYPQVSRCHFYGMTENIVSSKDLRKLHIEESLLEKCGAFIAQVSNVSKLIFEYSFAGGCPHSWFQSDEVSTLNLDSSTLSSMKMNTATSNGVRGRHVARRSLEMSGNYDTLDSCPSTKKLPKIGMGTAHAVYQVQYFGESAVLIAPRAKNENPPTISVEEILDFRKRLSLHHSSLTRLYSWCYVDGKGIAEIREKSDGYETINTPPQMFKKLTMVERLKLAMDVSRGLQFLHAGTPLGDFFHGDLTTKTAKIRHYVMTHNVVIDFDNINAQLIDFDKVFEDWGPREQMRRDDVKYFGHFLLQLLLGDPDIVYLDGIPPPVNEDKCHILPEYCQIIDKCISTTLYPHLTIDQVGRELGALWERNRPL